MGQRSTQTGLSLFGAMLALVLLAVLLHGLGLGTQDLDSSSEQLMVVGRGETLGALFAALLGAMSITAEFRHGTIQPTFLFTPAHGRVVAAKVWVSALLGTVFGLAAAAVAAGAGTAALGARGIDVRLDAGDYAVLPAGGATAAAFWAAIGVGVGSVVRNERNTDSFVNKRAPLIPVQPALRDRGAAAKVTGSLGTDAARDRPFAAGAPRRLPTKAECPQAATGTPTHRLRARQCTPIRRGLSSREHAVATWLLRRPPRLQGSSCPAKRPR